MKPYMMMLIPAVYAFAAFFATLAYMRKRFMVPDLSRCAHCLFRSFCERTRLYISLPPLKLVRKPSKSFKAVSASIITLGILLATLMPLMVLGSEVSSVNMLWLLGPRSLVMITLAIIIKP